MTFAPPCRSTAALVLAPLLAATVAACGPDTPEQPGTNACAGVEPGELAITEIFNDGPGIDTGAEWVELYNTTDRTVSLVGLTLYVARYDGSQMKQLRLTEGKLDADDFFVLGDVREGPNPPHVDVAYANRLGALPNENGMVGIKCGSKVIDEVKYAAKSTAGKSMQLNGALPPDSAANDVEANWCTATAEYRTEEFGTPGQSNTVCEDGPVDLTGCVDAATGERRDLVSPVPGDLVITEFMANPKAVSDSHGEWIEVLATRDVDLNGVTIQNESGRKSTLGGSACLRVGQGEHVLLARLADPLLNGGMENVFAMFSVSLGNSGTRWLEVVFGETVLDKATYSSVGDGISTQLAPEAGDPEQNDTEENWCRTAEAHVYGLGDRGTPGAPNPACTSVDPIPTGCFDAVENARRDLVPPAPGDLVITEFMPSAGSVADTAGEWFEVFVKKDVDLNGLVVANEGSGSTVLASDDCLSAASGAHLVFARNADPLLNGGLEEVFATFSFFLANSGTRAIELRYGETVLDRAAYTSTTKGASTQLSASAYELAERNESAWCRTPEGTTFGAGDRGTPGALNGDCPVDPGPLDGCEDPVTSQVRDLVAPQAGDLVITEILANPEAASDANGEWVEVYATKAVDLNGVALSYDTSPALELTARECLRVEPGTHLVFARNATAAENGGVESVYDTFSFQLANTGTHVLRLRHAEQVIDEASYTDAGAGVSTQLDAGKYDALLNDESTSWCASTAAFGAGDTGSPGAINALCASP